MLFVEYLLEIDVMNQVSKTITVEKISPNPTCPGEYSEYWIEYEYHSDNIRELRYRTFSTRQGVKDQIDHLLTMPYKIKNLRCWKQKVVYKEFRELDLDLRPKDKGKSKKSKQKKS